MYLFLASELSVLDSLLYNYNVWDFIIPKVDQQISQWDELPENLQELSQLKNAGKYPFTSGSKFSEHILIMLDNAKANGRSLKEIIGISGRTTRPSEGQYLSVGLHQFEVEGKTYLLTKRRLHQLLKLMARSEVFDGWNCYKFYEFQIDFESQSQLVLGPRTILPIDNCYQGLLRTISVGQENHQFQKLMVMKEFGVRNSRPELQFIFAGMILQQKQVSAECVNPMAGLINVEEMVNQISLINAWNLLGSPAPYCAPR